MEDLPDPNPDIIPDPTPDFISNLTFNSIPTSNSNPIPDPTSIHSDFGNQETDLIPLISLVSAEAFMRSMQSEGAQCYSS